MTKIEVARDVREENIRRSDALREKFHEAGLRVIGLLGSPGSGKTTFLENMLPRLSSKRISVIEGDVATDNDAIRINAAGVSAVQITTNGACHLDSSMVENAYSSIDAANTDILIIENVGNLVCPISFPVGEDIRIAIISAAEGEDKPQKYPSAVLKTDALIITKTDLAPLCHVDVKRMAQYAKDINPDIRIFFAGFDENGQYVCNGETGSIEDYILK